METIGKQLFNQLFTALISFLCDDLTFVSAEVALTDSDLFFPAAIPTAVVGAVALATFSKQDSITHMTFSGRGALGSKVNMKVYGGNLGPDTLPVNAVSDFLITSVESPTIASAVLALNVGGNNIVAVDNTKPVFHQQATVKVNDFWLRRVRQGL